MSGPLSGIKVVSLTHYLQGPSCVQFLGDLGADVVKVERIGGAYERYWSGVNSFLSDDTSVFFALAGRNQRSVEFNIQSEEGKETLWRLIDNADVLVENFRPGTLDKRGFSYEDVKARNPNIIYCSLTGFGTNGPMRAEPGQDLLLQSLSGLATLSGRAGDPPVLIGSAIVDQHAATLGALGIIAALFNRQRTGKGSKIDSNLLSAALDLQLEPFNYHINGAKLYERSENGVSSRFHQAPYGVFKTSDGWLTMSLSDGATLAKAFNDEGFTQFTRSDQFDKREEITKRVAEHMLTKTTQGWVKQFGEIGVWCAKVRNYDDVAADPQLAANQSIIEYKDSAGGDVRLLAHPVLYDGKALPMRIKPPALGQDTVEVLSELGYSPDDINKLRQSGAIGPDRAVEKYDRKKSAPASSYSRKSKSDS